MPIRVLKMIHPSPPPVFNGVRIALSLVFCEVFCRLLFVRFHLTIVLSVLRYTASDYPFAISSSFSQTVIVIYQNMSNSFGKHANPER